MSDKELQLHEVDDLRKDLNTILADLELLRTRQGRIRKSLTKSLHRGNEDAPGYVQLPEISPLLFFGNKRSAAHGTFEVVVSAVYPVDANRKPDLSLATHFLPFSDQAGREDDDGATCALWSIICGVHVVDTAIQNGQRTLVHCEWGQNRSGAIICAYAVLCRSWGAQAAIHYARHCNRKERVYQGQSAMHNVVFCKIIHLLERFRTGFCWNCGLGREVLSDKYTWTQIDSKVKIRILVNQSCVMSDIMVAISEWELELSSPRHMVIHFFAPVKVTSCSWILADGHVAITLDKQDEEQFWPMLVPVQLAVM